MVTRILNSPRYLQVHPPSHYPVAVRPSAGHGLPILDFSRSHTTHCSPRSPMGEWSARRLDLYLRTHERSCSQRDSIPQAKQASGSRPRGYWDSLLITCQHTGISYIPVPVTRFLFQKHRIKENSCNVLFVTMDRSDKSLRAFITFYCFLFQPYPNLTQLQPSLWYQDQFHYEVYVQVWAEIYCLYNKNRSLLTVLGHTNPIDKCRLLFFNNFKKTVT